MNLGDKMFELRKKKGFSQEEVAELIHVTRQTISKWETNQSTPDFDKIKPLCDLYEVSCDELLGTSSNVKEYFNTEEGSKKKSALLIASGVFCYFLAIALIVLCSTIFAKPILGTVLFFIACGLGTSLLIYNGVVSSKNKKAVVITPAQKKYKTIEAIVASIFTIIYLLISFLTMAWHLTWIIWVVYGLICEIIKLIFLLKKEDLGDEE